MIASIASMNSIRFLSMTMTRSSGPTPRPASRRARSSLSRCRLAKVRAVPCSKDMNSRSPWASACRATRPTSVQFEVSSAIARYPPYLRAAAF